MKSYTIWVEDNLWMKFKAKCSLKHTNIKQQLLKMIKEYVEKDEL